MLSTCELDSPLPGELARRGIPFVFVNRESERAECDAFLSDNATGTTAVARLLTDLGHRRVAAVFGPRTTSTGRDREATFRDALAARGTALPADYTHSGAFTHATGVEAISRFASLALPPSAVFCANDVIAIGALNGAAACGLRVPDDMSVVGFDDITAAGWERINLTTVHVDLSAMAAAAADGIIARIASGWTAPQRRVFPASIMLRGSHAALRPDG